MVVEIDQALVLDVLLLLYVRSLVSRTYADVLS